MAIAAAVGGLVGLAVQLMFAAVFPPLLIILINVVIGVPIGWYVANRMWPWVSRTQRPQRPVQWTEDQL